LKEEELESWWDHLDEVFENTPRDYFVRHWKLDPWRDLDGIRVAVIDSQIASTVRVFIRKCYVNGKEFTMGGIGEVSTKQPFRKRGLSSQLLGESVHFMKQQRMSICGLHTSSAASLYASLGWKSVPRYFVKYNLSKWNSERNLGIEPLPEIRKFDFDSEEEIMQLMELHKNYAKEFNGPLVRDSKVYWTHWIKREPQQTFLFVKKNQDSEGMIHESIEGYISVGIKRDNHRVKDFFVSRQQFIGDRGLNIFNALMTHYVQQLTVEQQLISNELIYPAPLFLEEPNVTDEGTMYLILDETSECSLEILRDGTKHLFWDIDGF